jgi:hypothetical protein
LRLLCRSPFLGILNSRKTRNGLKSRRRSRIMIPTKSHLSGARSLRKKRRRRKRKARTRRTRTILLQSLTSEAVQAMSGSRS